MELFDKDAFAKHRLMKGFAIHFACYMRWLSVWCWWMFPDQAGDYFVIKDRWPFQFRLSAYRLLAQSTGDAQPFLSRRAACCLACGRLSCPFLCRRRHLYWIYPGDGGVTDCLKPGLPVAGCRYREVFMCGPGIDSACRFGCAVQSAWSTLPRHLFIIGISSLVYAA